MKLNEIYQVEIVPFMKRLFNQMIVEQESFQMEGIDVYNPKAQFVGGKVINFSTYVATQLLDDSERENGLCGMRKLIQLVSKLPMETWGILQGISGIYRLKEMGLLESQIEPSLLMHYKSVLDWRTFVDEKQGYVLIDKPTNYYGVAFGIARYRELLGWDEMGASSILLEKLLNHIEQFSGKYLCMDDTDGEGRFDRYSMIISGEIAELLLNTGLEVSDRLKPMLEKSKDIFLAMANVEGTGFPYGRSIGAYGNTAALGLLSVAATIPEMMTAEEKKLAYDYSTRLMQNFADVWIDSEMSSINMWKKGRKTDNYRGINRILSENLSLCMQLHTYVSYWNQLGFQQETVNLEEYQFTLSNMPKVQAFTFADDVYTRMLYIIRFGNHVWSLPFINGGNGRKNDSQYLSIPFQQNVIEGIPEIYQPFLVPNLQFESGMVATPMGFAKDVHGEEKEDCYQITAMYDELYQIDAEKVITKLQGCQDNVIYSFYSDKIVREDRITVNDQEISSVELQFFTFETNATLQQQSLEIASGKIKKVKAEGYQDCALFATNGRESYQTPHGAYEYAVIWKNNNICEKEICLKWTMELV